MSLISGVINWKSTLAAPAVLARVMAEQARVGGRDDTTWHTDRAILGHQRTASLPGTIGPCLVHDSVSGQTITADARLDNRDDLFNQLRTDKARGEEASDGEIILRAYQKWGLSSPHYLLGDFASAIWDEREQQLFAARDAFGVRPFYYHLGNDRLVFASDLPAVFKAGNVPRGADNTFLAATLSHHARQPADRTAYAAIRRLAPGHAMLAWPDQSKIRVWWNADDLPAVRFRTMDDYIEALRDLLRQAVRSRLPTSGAVGAHLSGGLDSSSVAVLAARALHEDGRRLNTFFWGPPVGPNGFFPEDERVSVAEICRRENISCQYTHAEMIDAARWRIRSAGDRPAGNSYREPLVRQMAAEHGIRVMLSGLGGNVGVSFNPRRYRTAYLFPRQRWRVRWEESKARVQHYGGRLFRTYRGRLRSDWQRGRGHPLTADPLLDEILSYLRPEFVRQIAGTEPRRMPIFDCVRSAQLAVLTDGSLATQLEGWAAEGSRDGIEYRYPLLDRRVVEFALGLPAQMYCRRGWYRYLFRQAMDGILPESARRRIAFREPGVNEDRGRINRAFGTRALWPVIEPLIGRKFRAMNALKVREEISPDGRRLPGKWRGPLLALRIEMLLDRELNEAVEARIDQLEPTLRDNELAACA